MHHEQHEDPDPQDRLGRRRRTEEVPPVEPLREAARHRGGHRHSHQHRGTDESSRPQSVGGHELQHEHGPRERKAERVNETGSHQAREAAAQDAHRYSGRKYGCGGGKPLKLEA